MADNVLVIDTGFFAQMRRMNSDNPLEALNDLAQHYDKIKFPPYMEDELTKVQRADFEKWTQANANVDTYDIKQTTLDEYAGLHVPEAPKHHRADWEIKYEIEQGTLKGETVTVATSDTKLANYFDNKTNISTHRGIYDYLNTQVSTGKMDYETYGRFHDAAKDNIRNYGKDLPTEKLGAEQVEKLRILGPTDDMARVLNDPDVKGFSADPDMKTQHYYSERQNSVVTIDAEKGLSIETPNEGSKNPKHIFGEYRQAAADDFPEFHKAQGGVPDLHKGGISGVADATRAINVAIKGGDLGRAVGKAAGETAEVLGKVTKLLGPIGFVAAGVEGAKLEAKALEFESYGMMSQSATLAYTGLIGTHIGQATFDPSLLGGEIPVQKAYDAWAKKFDISDAIKQELEPGSLVEDLVDAAKVTTELGYDLAEKGAKALYELGKNNPELLDKLTGSNADKLQDFMEKSPIEQMKTLQDFIEKALPGDSLTIPQGFDIMPIIPNEIPSHDGGINWPSIKEILPDLPNLGIPKMQIPNFQIRAETSEYGAQIQHASFSEANVMPVSSGKVSLEDAITMLATDQKTLSAAAEQGQISNVEKTINNPDAAKMFQNLHNHGIKALKANITPDMSAEDRASELLLAGRSATAEAGIPMPAEQRDLTDKQELNNSYEDDHSFSI
ncbi:MAG: hypothetical protein ABJG88_05265 [Litorimonas sp.]